MLSEQGCGFRLSGVLQGLGIARSSWYARPKDGVRGRKPVPIDETLRAAVKSTAERYPWWGYKRIAVVCRNNGLAVSNRCVYRIMRDAGLLQRKRVRVAEVYQAAKLFELLPSRPNEVWQCDVTYVHVPGSGWWYAVTVIDYYSRYLLACHFTPSQRADDLSDALDLACEEAKRCGLVLPSKVHLVTDNGPAFLSRKFHAHIKQQFQHVRIAYRTPTQLGLLERFHQTLKTEEVYWRLYDSVAHARRSLAQFHERYNQVRPHWALVPVAGGDPVTPAKVYVDGLDVGLPRWQHWARAARRKLEQMTDNQHFPLVTENIDAVT